MIEDLKGFVAWYSDKSTQPISIYQKKRGQCANTLNSLTGNGIFVCLRHLQMLSEKQKKEIIEAIEDNIDQVKLKIDEYRELTKPIAPENAIGRVSRMDAINNKSVNEAALRQAELKLKKMEQALEKIDQSHFGTCTGCGEQIPLGRIMLMPESTRCVRCAQ